MKSRLHITEREIGEFFSRAKAIITGGHFVYDEEKDGWYHGSTYIDKYAVYPHTRSLRPLCKAIADNFRDCQVEAVVGSTVGGARLSQWVAYLCAPSERQEEVLAVTADEEEVMELQITPVEQLLNRMYEYKTALTESRKVVLQFDEDHSLEQVFNLAKIGARRALKHGYSHLVCGKRCLIVTDFIEDGVNERKVIESVQKAEGKVIGVGVLCNLSGGKVTEASLGVAQLFSLKDLVPIRYPEAECPICREQGFASIRTDLGKGSEFFVRKGLLKI